MKATRSFLVIPATTVAAACSPTSSPVAPDAGARSEVVQATSGGDSVSSEQRGVYTLGSGN